MGNSFIDKTLALLNAATQRAASSSPGTSAFKAGGIETGLGYVWYDLQPVASQLFPVITPLRNRIPRVAGNGGTGTHWKGIMGINTTLISPGVSEGHRNAFNVTAEQDFSATYATLGHDDFVSEQARQASGQLTPAVDGLAVQDLLLSVMIDEEFVLVNGNSSLALGTTPPPAATLVAGGNMNAEAKVVFCVALTPDGYRRATVAGGLPGPITRTNADGSVDTINPGSAKVSAASNGVTTAAGNLSVSAHVARVKGAVAYAWYIGPAAATAKLGAITTINSVLFTAEPAGTQAADDAKISADYSRDNLVHDGILSLAFQGTGYWIAQATGTDGTGTALTANGTGGVNEIDADLKYFWDNFRLSPTEILVSAQEMVNITNKVIGGSGAPLFRFLMDAKGQANGVTAGVVVGSYLNKVGMGGTGQEIPIRLHPNIVPGMILYWTDRLPYPLVNTRNIVQVRERRGYRQVDWPIVTQRQEYGVYVDQLLELRAPFAFGARVNIANG